MIVTPPDVVPQKRTHVMLYELTFPEVQESARPVVSMTGHLVGGPDRRGAYAPIADKLWRSWQEDVKAASRRRGAVPQRVEDYFQKTKGLSRPPLPGDRIEATGLVFAEDGGATQDDLDMHLSDVPSGQTLSLAKNPDDLWGLMSPELTHPNPRGATAMTKPFRFATSFSGMESFQQCPFRWAQEKFYKTIPYEQSEAAADGDRGHKTAENYLLNALAGTARLPVDDVYLGRVKKYCDLFLASGAEIHVEREMCCTKDLRPCGWKDWNTVWFRGRGDVMTLKNRHLNFYDWKFGKRKDDPFQIRVMIALASLIFPGQFDTAGGKLIFVKEVDPRKALVGLPKPITAREIPQIWEEIFAITNRMEAACASEVFRKCSSGLCKAWCPVLVCEHNGRR